MHNVTVVRSVTHKYPLHGVATRHRDSRNRRPDELAPHDSKHWPFIRQATVAHLEHRKNPASALQGRADNCPALPLQQPAHRRCSARSVPGVPRNQFARTSRASTGRRRIRSQDITDRTIEFDEPYAGTTPESYFALGGEPAADLTSTG